MDDQSLEKMSKEELLDLQKRVEKTLKAYDARRKAEAKAAAEAAAKEMGFKLSDLVSDAGSSGTVNAPKYKDPKDPTQTWTGRGRKPKWFEERLEEGVAKEDMAIAG